MLTSKAVDEMMGKCVFADGEAVIDAIEVEGIVSRYTFHPERIAQNTDLISKMLAELPDEFHTTKGGGWSFLNACMDRNGHQWTDLHQQQERLFALGIAAGKARWMMPRDMWPLFPGGMPYVSVSPIEEK